MESGTDAGRRPAQLRARCRFGVIDPREGDAVRVTDVVTDTGARCVLELEGLEGDAGDDFLVVTDMDAIDQPALLGRLRVDGL